MYQLFDDQIPPVNESIHHLKSGLNVLLYAPTAAGKTVMASEIARQMACVTIFLVNKQILVGQSYEKLIKQGLNTAVFHNTITKTVDGVVMNDDYLNAEVLISLVETLGNGEVDFSPKLIVIDEAHKATSEVYQIFRDKYPEAVILGLTATPARLKNKEGEALSEWYDVMVITDTIRNLIKKGRLATPVYRIFEENDHVVNNWLNLTEGEENRRSIVFTSNARHSLAVKSAFEANGIAAEIVTSGTELEDVKDILPYQTPNQRNEIFRKFRAGEVEVLISFGVLCEGFDEPLAKYCLLLRKVSHIALLHQMIGRVLRKADGKPFAYILDFTGVENGNIAEYGEIENYIWEMDGTGYKDSMIVADGSTIHFGHYRNKSSIHVVCSDCRHVYNIKKFDVCSVCRRKNKVEMSISGNQLVDLFDEYIGRTVLLKLPKTKPADRLRVFLNIVRRVNNDVNSQAKFNETYLEIFQDGKIKSNWGWWLKLLSDNAEHMSRDAKYKIEL